MALFEPRSTT